MKTIKKIFTDDIVSLFRNFFALVIAIGICFLPALYAWFNIYSNWDPYGSTGNLKMAVFSEDTGYVSDDGEYQNQGQKIIDELHDNTSIDWQFVDSADEAIDGVYSGEYYGAIVIDENFTYSLYNVFSDENDEPTLIFYQNQKKNPVATKISDTVVSTLQNNIDEAFVDVVVSEVFSKVSDLYDETDDDDTVNDILDNLQTLSDDLTTYEATIDSVVASNKLLQSGISSAQSDATYLGDQSRTSAGAVDSANSSVATTQLTINVYEQNVNLAVEIIKANIADMKTTIEQARLSGDYETMMSALRKVNTDLDNIVSNKAGLLVLQQDPAVKEAARLQAKAEYEAANGLGSWTDDVESVWSAAYDAANGSSASSDSSDSYIQIIRGIIQQYADATAAGNIEVATQQLSAALSTIYGYADKLEISTNTSLIPNINTAIDGLEDVLAHTSEMLNQMADTFDSTAIMFSALGATLDSADISLEKTTEALEFLNQKLISVIDQTQNADVEDKMQILVNVLAGNPDAYGKFFSEPVEVETQAVYPIANYGSAVAPFYTTLALWVGALILTAIIKVHPDKAKYPEATDPQLFFGRFVLYWILGQIQAVIIVVGDLALLGVQCVEPGFFMLAASLASTTFTILIYSLVVTWGDVGKALSVVIVVLQIAGSSGTYPIELLPEFFQKVYIFFPFPYAINAMRECTCGMYENDYLVYMLQLSFFILISLVIGLILKIPFEEINHYMEKRMEDTGMM